MPLNALPSIRFSCAGLIDLAFAFSATVELDDVVGIFVAVRIVELTIVVPLFLLPAIGWPACPPM